MPATAEHPIVPRGLPVRLAALRARLAAAPRALTARDLGTLLAALALAFATWPSGTLVPGIDGDWNWIAGFAVSAEHGLRFGDQIVWTSGPLGFLNSPPLLYYGDIAIVTFAFQWLVQMLLAGTLFLALRRSFHVLVALVVAAAVTAMLIDHVLMLGVAWCVLMLMREEGASRTALATAFPYAIGVLTGVAVLGKLNQGVELIALSVVVLVAAPSRTRRRDAAAYAAALLATAAVGWFSRGQTLGDVWPYLRYTKEIVTGYPAAMGLADSGVQWAIWAAALIAAIALMRVLDATQGTSVRRRAGLLALWAISTFLSFREGFVRQDSSHVFAFFANMLVLLAVLPVRPMRRAFALTGMASCAALAAAAFGPYDFGVTFNAIEHAKTAVDEARTLAARNDRGAAKARLRHAIVAHYALPPEILGGVGRRTVAFWPHAFGDLVYAHELNWRPPPVLEPYSAYTPALDRLDARMLASDRAPARIIRSTTPSIDDRNPTFEAPLATLGIICRYREVVAKPPWQLLARSADRCGAPRVVRSLAASWGAQVAVPAHRSDALLLVRIDGVSPHGLERALALTLRPHERWIALDAVRFHLIDATAPDGLLLSAPPRADYPGPFAMARNPAHIAVTRDGGNPGGTLRFTFVEVPIRPFATGAHAG